MKRRTRIPDLLVEQLVLGELPPRRAAKVRAALEVEEVGLERLAAIEASNRETLERYPPGAVAAEVASRQQQAVRAKREFKMSWMVVPLTAALAVVVYLVLPDSGEQARHGFTVEPGRKHDVHQAQEPRTDVETVRKKGDFTLMVFLQVDGESERMESGDTVAEGDVLQLKYEAGRAAHGVILSVDGRGAATLHFPTSIGHPTRLDSRGPQALFRAYELDDAPEYERFFFIVSAEPLDVGALLAGVEALGTDPEAVLALEDGLGYKEFVVLKPSSTRIDP